MDGPLGRVVHVVIKRIWESLGKWEQCKSGICFNIGASTKINTWEKGGRMAFLPPTPQLI